MGEDICKNISHKRITFKICKELMQFNIKKSNNQVGVRYQNKRQEFTTTHKYIKDTSTNRKILRDHLLNASGKPWKPKTRKDPTQPGRTKGKKEEEEETGKDQQPW